MINQTERKLLFNEMWEHKSHTKTKKGKKLILISHMGL